MLFSRIYLQKGKGEEKDSLHSPSSVMLISHVFGGSSA